MHRYVYLSLVGTIALASPSLAQTGIVNIGTLTCDVKDGAGFVFGSSKDLNCTWVSGQSPPKSFEGTISKWGVDVGYRLDGKLFWNVLAPTTNVSGRSIEGTYSGGGAQATVAVGSVSNFLLGGFDRSIALQPLPGGSANVAAGIGSLTLVSSPDNPCLKNPSLPGCP